MRVLIAPDKFKGSLTAFDAVRAMARGVERACSGATVHACPLSDGGEGFSDVLLASCGGTRHGALVRGALGDAVTAHWVMLDDGATAIVETAAAIGLTLVPEERRRPTETTSAGVGDLIRSAMDRGARRIVIGLGGTATTDGGAGMAQALGVAFAGAPSPLTGRGLGAVRGVELAPRDPRLARVELVAVTDVDNPLAGPEGAAHVYAPQKGATPDDVAVLDGALAHLAHVAGDPGVTAGDGAAGGLGYGLRVFLGATRRRGVDFVLAETGFDRELDACDLVLTGEGRLDEQTASGKVVAGVSARAFARGVPVIGLVGAVAEGVEPRSIPGLTACFSSCSRPMSTAESMANAASLLEELTANVVRAFCARETRRG